MATECSILKGAFVSTPYPTSGLRGRWRREAGRMLEQRMGRRNEMKCWVLDMAWPCHS